MNEPFAGSAAVSPFLGHGTPATPPHSVPFFMVISTNVGARSPTFFRNSSMPHLN
jgi:hypothetical protein